MTTEKANQPGDKTRSGPATGYPAHLDWNHKQFYPVRCPVCGWMGMSDETEGGNQIADTGDYTQIVCQKCLSAHGKGYMHDDARWVPVEDLPEPDNEVAQRTAGGAK